MSRNAMIGSKIKQLRTEKRYTLKELSAETGLSVGFLSQLERGLSSIAIDSLAKIADLLGVTLTSFFDDEEPERNPDPVVHGFDLHHSQISPQIIQFVLSHDVRGFDHLPRMIQLMPFADTDGDELEMYTHTGEEFVYVLEGVVTVYIGEQQHVLYPGDSIQIHSEEAHNWTNRTNRLTKILTINYPNPFTRKTAEEERETVRGGGGGKMSDPKNRMMVMHEGVTVEIK